MKENFTKRVLSLVLCIAMLLSLAAPAAAVSGNAIAFHKSDAPSSLEAMGNALARQPEAAAYEDEDVVRVSIVLKEKSTLQAGFSTHAVAENAAAMGYRAELKEHQKSVTADIERAMGGKLDVVWNLTLAANLISANVPYGSIAKIEAVKGVSKVMIEQEYEPAVVADSATETVDPNQISSTLMSGAATVWTNGYTGAGSRVAVIDTGIDNDHQSFSAAGLEYSLTLNAEAEGKTKDAYLAELDLLDAEEIASKLDQLNIQGVKADRLYQNIKIPFGYNYIDQNYKVTHDYDEQSEHGSHVEGIAAANSYIPMRDGSFAEALELTNVKGQAPDAQIIAMKVFGVNGGAYDSDYMAAIEDAIVLGADAVNLSLGSGSSGFSFSPTYAELLDGLQETDTVVTISAGNSYSWDYSADHTLYASDIRFSTGGSPGSFSNSLGVASVDSTYFNDDGSYTPPAFYTMSDFSSWGVPESLELKPEITAPGGNIYSVNGLVAGGKSYESMSGTSMAAPQMAGMAAVMAEYIRENDLVEKTGLTIRQLSQSLLMSTAEALLESEGVFYSVLKQGAGMARLDNAVASQTYILMGDDATAYAGDGKVKAELGHDPEKTGSYGFTFSLNNIGAEDTVYTLSANLFTQEADGRYHYENTESLGADVVFVVDGVTYVPAASGLECDLNGDGLTNAEDAKVILNYTVGNTADIDAAADLDQSGAVDAYDAHLILAGLETGEITVPAGASVQVEVQAQLTEAQMDSLNETHPNGAYVEGFVFANGEVTHSIPVLGFYGNWSDPDFFGATYADLLYGESWKSYFGSIENNELVLEQDGKLSFVTGNPYALEDAFPADKLALRSDTLLSSYRLSLLRNAGALMLTIQDENGKELYNSGVSNQVFGAYYYVNGNEWRNVSNDYTLGFSAASLGLEEGQSFTVTVAAIPESYIPGKLASASEVHKILSSGTLGQGAVLSRTLTVDDTAPEIVSIARDIETDDVVVTLRDNLYPAAIRIVDSMGTVHATQTIPTQGEAGTLQQVSLNLDGVAAGDPCYISVGDYAGNEAVYEASLGLDEPGAGGGTGGGAVTGGNLYAYSNYTATGWVRMDANTGTYSVVAPGALAVTAAEYVDGYIYMVGTDGMAYVAPHSNPTALVTLADLSAYGVEDMAFNYADKQMYVLGADNTFYTMDLATAELTEVFTVSVINNKNAACTWLRALGIDEEGNFYVAADGGSGYEFGACMFKFTLDMVVDGAITDLKSMSASLGYGGYIGGYTDNGQTLAWDHENDKLYYYSWGRYNIDNFGTIAMRDGSLSSSSLPKLGMSAIYFPGLSANVIQFATEAESLELNVSTMKMLEGSSTTLSASIKPWTLKDQSLTWVSSDENVVTVKDGVVRAVGKGEATITVTTNAPPNLSATVKISVSGIPTADLYAQLLDVDGVATWISFNADNPEGWKTEALDTAPNSYGAVNLNDVIYVHDGSTLYAMNPDTFEKEAIGGIGSDFAWTDAAAAPFDCIVAPCYSGTGVAVIDPEGDELVPFDLSAALGGDLLTTMAYAYSEGDAHTFYSVTESGKVFEILLTVTEDGYELEAVKRSNSVLNFPGASEAAADSTIGSVYDAESGTIVIASYTEGDATGYVYALEPLGGASLTLGSIGDAVWPFYSLYQYEAPDELTLRVRTERMDLYVGDSAKFSAAASPAAYAGRLIYSVADESIASVDDNGVVLAKAPGDTTVTVTTMDTLNGAPLSATIPLHVEDTVKIDLTLGAKLDFDDLGSKWVTLNTKDLQNPEIVTDDHAYLSHAAVHNGVIYANDGKFYIDWNYWAVVSNLYIIEPEHGYDITPGGLIGAENMPTDMSTMPAMELSYVDAEGKEATITAGDLPIYMDQSEQLIMWNVAAGGDIAELSGWNMEGDFDGIPSTLAYMGMTKQTDDEGNELDAWSYAVLTDSGEMYTINVTPYVDYDGESYYVDYSAYIDHLGNVGLSFDYGELMQMVYVNDGVNQGFLISYCETVAELYYIDLEVDALKLNFVSGKIGSIPGTNTIGGMYFAEELQTEAPELLSRGELVQPMAKVGPDRSYTVPAKLTNDRLTMADGSLAAAKPNVETVESGKGVKLNLTEEQETVSGMVTVTYDADVLTYTGSASRMVTAEKAEDGKLTLAYAKGSGIAAGDLLASLSFSFAGDYASTTVTVETLQRNAEGVLTGETETVTVTLEPNGHAYAETARTEPTCETEGSVTYTCAHCGHSYTEVLAATGHSYEAVVTEPTCTEGGYTTYTCANCGDSYVADETAALGHSFGEWTVTAEPTHSEAGSRERKCACGETETEVLPAIGHNYVEIVVAPTCTEGGHTVHACSCGDVYYTDLTDALGHSYEASVTAPTCTEGGYTTYTCTVCGHSYVADQVPALGHSFGEWTVTVEPTHTEPGSQERKCACGETETQVLAPIGHDFEATVIAPTCTEDGYTLHTCDCGVSYISDLVEALGHSYESVTTEATCTEPGFTTHTCSVCGHSFVDGYTAPNCPSAQFADVHPSQWYHDAVDFAVSNGFMTGMSESIFAPDGTVTRGQLLTVLYRVAGSPAVPVAAPFADVAEDAYYADAIAWAYAMGIAKGVSASAFDPEGAVTREQMVTFLARFAACFGLYAELPGDLSAFTDGDSVSDWAKGPMFWAVQLGLIQGKPDGSLAPTETTTRAQMATVIQRCYALIP